MRVGIISDIHGNSLGLAAVLADLDKVGVELIVCAGDLVGYYPFVNETFELLRARDDVICILGNHDCYLLHRLPVTQERWRAYSLDYVDRTISDENRAWLACLPIKRRFVCDGISWLVCHGSPWSVEEYVYPEEVAFERFDSLETRVVVLGHTHIPLVRKTERVLLVNPGSCGQPRDFVSLAACAVVDTAANSAEIRRVAYNIDAVCQCIVAEGLDPRLADILKRTHKES